MAIRIEYLTSGDDQTAVQETLNSLSAVAERINGIEVEVKEPEKQAGFFEHQFVGTLIVSGLLPIATGLVTNAIWAWFNSRGGKVKTPVDQEPERPIEVQLESVQILIVITEDQDERRENG